MIPVCQVEWDGKDYWLVAVKPDGTPEGFKKKSLVLSCEAVSYVSSAYIPACLRQGGRPTLSNAHRYWYWEHPDALRQHSSLCATACSNTL